MAATLDPLGGPNMMGYNLPEEDVDAEHEDDPMMDGKMFIPRHAALGLQNTELVDGSAQADEVLGDAQEEQLGVENDDDTSSDDDNEDDEDDEGEAVGPVKLPNGEDEESASEASEDDDHAPSIEEPSNLGDSDKDSSDAESDGGAEWEEQSDDRDEDDGGLGSNNRCLFCGEDEDHDPSEEYEEYLACLVCGDNAHRQCARDSNALDADGSDAERWKCPACVELALEPEAKEQRLTTRRSSSSKLTRDLLPVQADAGRPGSHSVFNQLIVNDDPLDGSRLLRKRKSSTDDVDESRSASTKRLKSSRSSSESAGSSTSAEITGNPRGKTETRVEETVNKQSEPPAPSTSPKPRPSRPRAPKKVDNPCVRLLVKDRKTLKLCLRVDPSALSRILSAESQRKRRRVTRPPEPPQPPPPQPMAQPPTFTQPTPFSSSYAAPFYSFHERENDELKSKPYGGILSEADADTSKTLPQLLDRDRFNEAKRKAEEAWHKKNADNGGESGSGMSQKVAGPASKIQCINFGGYEIDTWYAAPYPEEYSRNRVLYICEFCLKYMNSDYVAWRHKLKCPAKHPPGDEIYRDGSVSVFEVDGRKNPVYCQNLCLLAKLFLGSKTLYYDVEPFLFYVMTEYDELGCHFVGYFSKEKRPSSSNNVSCILTLPIHQRKGYGNLLIDFSYLLTRVEKKTGSPEKPLSDMGLVSYRNYWRLVLCYQLRDQKEPVSIADISKRTGMTADDIVSALEGLRALVRDPVTGTYALRLDYNYFREYIEKWEAKKYMWLNPDCLLWTPYIMGRSNLAHLEHAPPLATMAPRDDEETNEQDETKAKDSMEMDIDEDDKDHARMAKINGVNPAEASKPPVADSDRTHHHAMVGDLHPVPGPPPKTPLAKPPSLPVSSRSVLEGVNGISALSLQPTPGPPAIPPTRFEIYPPLPGTASRRRAGRPPTFGRRRTTTPGSASRRQTTTGKSSGGPRNARNKNGTFASKSGSTTGRVNASSGKGAAATAASSFSSLSSSAKRTTRTKPASRSEAADVNMQLDTIVDDGHEPASAATNPAPALPTDPVAPNPLDHTSEAQLTKEMQQASIANNAVTANTISPAKLEAKQGAAVAVVQRRQDVMVLVKRPPTTAAATNQPVANAKPLPSSTSSPPSSPMEGLEMEGFEMTGRA